MRSSRARVVLIVSLVVVLVGLAVGWFFLNYERVQIEEQSGYTGMAGVNPFHAAELLLEELHIPTESRYGLGVLPPTDHSIVVLTMDRQARRTLEPTLREWVNLGGHLIVAAVPPDPSRLGMIQADDEEDDEEDEDEAISVHDEDPLLVMAGLTLARTETSDLSTTDENGTPAPSSDGGPVEAGAPDGGEPDGGAAKQPAGSFQGLLQALGFPTTKREVVSVVTPNGARQLEAKMDTRWTLVDAISESHMMSYELDTAPRQFVPVRVVPMERGWVTAVVDPYFMTNQAIGDHDHARLAHELTLIDFAPPTGAVFVIRAHPDGLFAMLWRHGWMAIISLALLLLAWVWGASRRFGPVLPKPDRSRRSLMEHIEAAGNFLWRQGYHEVLLTSTREALKHHLAARLGGDTELEGDALEHAISAETGVRESRIHEAFYGGQPNDKKAFTEAMQELQRLWRTK